jgi:transcriptional regulator with XRE-family HTH domain
MARKLRSEGLSVREIERRLGVARSSVSVWVRDVPLTETQLEYLAHAPRPATTTRHRRLREQCQAQGRALANRGEPLHAIGCMLFWAEGAKEINKVHLTNSDPELLRLFTRFLRHYFDVPNERIRILCNLFTDHLADQWAVEQFWLDVLELPRSSLWRSVVNAYSRSSQRTRCGKLPYGTCRVTVHDVRIAQHLYGAIQEYGGFERPEWLG